MKPLATAALRRILFLLALACPVLLSPAATHAQIFWANFVSDAIGGANLDGTGATQAFISGSDGDGPSGVAVGGAYIYWTNRTVNTIGRANLDGTGAVHDFITGASAPTGIAVDGSYIYWANQNGHTIGRATLDRSEINHSFISGGSGPTAVAVDGTHIYWANQNGDTIGRANLNGTEAVQNFITGASDPTAVAVNGTHIYWGNDATGTIGRATLDLSEINQNLITGASGPYGMALDGSYVYWANRKSNRIGRANLDGTLPNQNFITTEAQPRGVALGPSSVLPVELITFTATVRASEVSLTWATASETNNAGFEIQQQHGDAWTALSFVPGAGTTVEAQHYSYTVTDLTPGLHRFRLKQVDYDGQFEYSPVVEVAVELPDAFLVSTAYPNPLVAGDAAFSVTARQAQPVQVALFDVLGRQVAVLYAGQVEASQPVQVRVGGDLAPGLYLVRVQGHTFTHTQKLLVQ